MDRLVVSGEEFAPVLHEILASGGTASIVVSGSSMRPLLKAGRDTVYLRTCTEKDLRRGQILLFKRPDGKLILHRIRSVLPNGQLVMNGDSQAWCETISYNRVIAVVSSFERKGQHISCNSARFRFWNQFWYPTRVLRPVLFKLWHNLFCRGAGSRGSTC